MTPNDLNELLKTSIAADILQELRQLNAKAINDDTLWDINDVASYLRVSAKHLQNNGTTERGDFPRAIALPLTEKRPTKRWKARAVINWASKHRAAVKPKARRVA